MVLMKSFVAWRRRDKHFFLFELALQLNTIGVISLRGAVPKTAANGVELSAATKLVMLSNLILVKPHMVWQGKVPQQIGQLKSIEVLDLSRNKFSGKLPVSLSQLNSLNFLDLSYNKFSGRIPSSTQIQSFNASKFIGNVGLCGPPLSSKCLGDESPPMVVGSEDHEGGNDDDGFMKWLYIGMASGFVTGFWGICGALFLNRRGRHAFFRFTSYMTDWIYVKIGACKF